MKLILKILIYVLFFSRSFTVFSLNEDIYLKVLSINVWSGLDYKGNWKFGEYESSQLRGKRFTALLKQIKILNPDVIFIQEANPLPRYSIQLADSLNYSEVHQVCNAGIKIGSIGIPINFKEGIAILARKNLCLEKTNTWKLSGSFGLHGDLLSIHFDESIFALAAKIKVEDTPIILVNVHLVAAPPFDSAGVLRRKTEVKKLLENLRETNENYPVILAGDFNATPESEEIQYLIRDYYFLDSYEKITSQKHYTWDGKYNPNTYFSSQHTDALGKLLTDEEIKAADYDTIQRRIDYIFFNNKFSLDDLIETDIVFDNPVDEVFISDHYGIYSKLNLTYLLKTSIKEPPTFIPIKKKIFEPLPIISYDTDVGFGYGAKAFFLNFLKKSESFDITLFNSTKGERWYRFVFSIPDFELRQGKIYDLAIDFIIDYDKWIRNSFFGIGNRSKFSDREIYTREPLEISLITSRGFTQKFAGQLGLKYKTIRNSNFSDSSQLAKLLPVLNSGKAKYSSLFLNFRYDTRNSFINPSRGSVVQIESEFAPKFYFNNVSFTKLSFAFQYYVTMFYPTTIFALRLNYQGVFGNSLPVQVLCSIGGNNNLRGSPQDRYLDKTSAIINTELRFPIFWRIGGMIGYDLGKVWNEPKSFDINRWSHNPALGLRLYMKTFVVRFDVGFGKETQGYYFNFGHLF